MINRPLEENEEVVGDKIAGLFYSDVPAEQSIRTQALAIANAELNNPEIGQYIVETTITRLYAEKTSRKKYLANKLKVNMEEDQDIENTLLSIDTSTLDADDAEQCAYFQLLSNNLLQYELELWKKEQEPVLGLIAKQSPDRLKANSEVLKSFADRVTSVRDARQYLSASLPEAVTLALKDLGLSQSISRYETIIGEATYCRYIGNLAEIASQELSAGTSNEDIAEIAAAATLRYKPLLIS